MGCGFTQRDGRWWGVVSLSVMDVGGCGFTQRDECWWGVASLGVMDVGGVWLHSA